MNTATRLDTHPFDAGVSRLGELLMQSGKMSETDVRRVLASQEASAERFGEIALQLGLVTQEDVERALFAQYGLPHVRAGESRLNPAIVAAYDPASAYAEAMRGLRSELLLRWFNEHKTLVIAETRRGSGCSVLAANLAVVFAQLGKRTLLIDANLRRPLQRTLFGVEGNLGLEYVLNDARHLDENVTAIDAFDNLWLLGGTAASPNPQELLARPAFESCMDFARRHFEIVLIEVPPLLECADAQSVLSRAGGCVLAARKHHSEQNDVARAQDYIAPTAAILLGLVLGD